jgi:hypothetical protein
MTKSTESLPLTISLQIPTYWTPEQAFAVFDLINDLREAIWQVLQPGAARPISRSRPAAPDRGDKDFRDPPF